MGDYDIDIEIYIDEGVIMAEDETTGQRYSYDLESVEGANILIKILGTDVRATVYTQDEEMTLEEYIQKYG